jgi:hypothetical protein
MEEALKHFFVRFRSMYHSPVTKRRHAQNFTFCSDTIIWRISNTEWRLLQQWYSGHKINRASYSRHLRYWEVAYGCVHTSLANSTVALRLRHDRFVAYLYEFIIHCHYIINTVSSEIPRHSYCQSWTLRSTLTVKKVKGRLAGSFGTATFRVDCTLPLT